MINEGDGVDEYGSGTGDTVGDYATIDSSSDDHCTHTSTAYSGSINTTQRIDIGFQLTATISIGSGLSFVCLRGYGTNSMNIASEVSHSHAHLCTYGASGWCYRYLEWSYRLDLDTSTEYFSIVNGTVVTSRFHAIQREETHGVIDEDSYCETVIVTSLLSGWCEFNLGQNYVLTNPTTDAIDLVYPFSVSEAYGDSSFISWDNNEHGLKIKGMKYRGNRGASSQRLRLEINGIDVSDKVLELTGLREDFFHYLAFEF
jgi:hypothetical protein